MSIPVGDRQYLEAARATALSEEPEGRCGWTSLEPAAKRERLLSAAFDVFARDGLDAPMSEVADAAGAGVASLYRCFASKHDLLAALVTRRMDQIVEAAQESGAGEGDRWSALTEMLRTIVQRQSADDVLGEARMAVADHPDVIASTTRATEAMERLLAAARAEGRLRADASALDLRLVFAATRAAKQVEPEQWPRMLELLIDALRARDPSD
jgi:AcrR family transcriptional regulator